MKTVITFRLRKELDADLIQLKISEKELSNLCRNGLRLALGIRTAKMIEVKEHPLQMPVEFRRTAAAPVTLFNPKAAK